MLLLTISMLAMQVMVNLLMDLLERIAREAAFILELECKDTLTVAEINIAAKLGCRVGKDRENACSSFLEVNLVRYASLKYAHSMAKIKLHPSLSSVTAVTRWHAFKRQGLWDSWRARKRRICGAHVRGDVSVRGNPVWNLWMHVLKLKKVMDDIADCVIEKRVGWGHCLVYTLQLHVHTCIYSVHTVHIYIQAFLSHAMIQTCIYMAHTFTVLYIQYYTL